MQHISASIYHMQNLVSKKTKKIVYLALLESILRYGVELWGAASLTNLEKIKKQQIRALKNVMNYKNAPTFTVNAFQDLKILHVFCM